MRKLKFLLTLLLVAVGVSSAKAWDDKAYYILLSNQTVSGFATNYLTTEEVSSTGGAPNNKTYRCSTTPEQFKLTTSGSGTTIQSASTSRYVGVNAAVFWNVGNVATAWLIEEATGTDAGLNKYTVKRPGNNDGLGAQRVDNLPKLYTNNSSYVWTITKSAIEITLNFKHEGTSVGDPYTAYFPLNTGLGGAITEHMPSGYAFTGTAPSAVDGTYSYDIEVMSAATVSGITLNYVDYITHQSVGTQDAGTRNVGTTIVSLATALPTGYKVLPGNTARVEDGTTSYGVSVVRTYEAPTGNLTRTDDNRHTEYITMQVGNTVQKLTGLQANNSSPIYYDLRGTDKYLTCPAGALIKFSSDLEHLMNAMQGYCYIDMDYDGTYSYFTNTADHMADPGSDLRAWGGYKFSTETWYNSEGKTPAADNGNPDTRLTTPAFTAPTTPGTYCLRFKIDWNNLEPAGTSSMNQNGGLIVDVFLVVTDSYTATYVDGEGNPVAGAMAVVSSGSSALNADGQNVIAVGSQVNGILSSADFQVRDVLTINGADATLADFASFQAGDEVVVKVAAPYIQDGKYYTIQHVANNRYAYDNASGTDDGENLMAEVVTTGVAGKHIFQIEAASAADGDNITDGMFYIKSAQTGRYVKTPSQVATDHALKTKTEMGALTNFVHWISNAVVPGNAEIFVLADAAQVADPTRPITGYFTWHNNNGNNVLRWRNVNDDNVTPSPNSQWRLKRVPVVSITFQDPNGEELSGITFTVDDSLSSLAAENKVLATVRNFVVNDYVVVGRQLKVAGSDHFENYNDDRAAFYTIVNGLTEDAEAIIQLRPHTDDEVDITLALWKAMGSGFTDEACTTGEVVYTDATAQDTGMKAWKLNNDGTLTDVKNKPVPGNIGFRIVATDEGTTNGVGGHIISTYSLNRDGVTYYPYKYGRTSATGHNCICFKSVKGEGNNFAFEVSNTNTALSNDTYYILQYEMGFEPGSNADRILITNSGGGIVQTANPASEAMVYNITDTPASQTCTMNAMLLDESTGSGDMATNFFQVRIVNQKYLENSRNYGRSIVWNALQGTVGYPMGRSSEEQAKTVRDLLQDALDRFDATGSVADYLSMLKAYSAFISSRSGINMGDDCAVYTLSFIDPEGNKMLINNGDSGLEIVPYIEANRAEKSARWISHKDEETGKMVFVSKKDGKYLQAKTGEANGGTGVSTYYDAATTAFKLACIHQDLNDYMQSATDEKLLGAVYMQSDGRVSNSTTKCCFSVTTDGAWSTNADPRYDHITAAIVVEEVENGNTFNHVTLNNFKGDGYATYYGFYPVQKPDGAHMYYVNQVDDQNYMELIEVRADVIRPYFPVILISEGNINLYEFTTEKHLHIGEYTEDVKNEIAGYLEGKTNVLQGTLDDILLADYEKTNNCDVYVLSKFGTTQEEIGFFHYYSSDYTDKNGNPLKMPVGKAFYTVPKGQTPSGIRGFVFKKDDGDVTRIDFTETEVPSTSDKVYDLSGRRVVKAQKGFYIVNGKKIIK